MSYSQYKFHFYLNASHAIYIGGARGEVHPHTWEITLYAVKVREEFRTFYEVETPVEELLSQYQDRLLNDLEPFRTMNPTLENMTRFLLENIQEVLTPLGWVVFTIEVAETPARAYIISLVENNIVYETHVESVARGILEAAFSKEA